MVKNPPLKCRRHRRHEFDPWVGKIPWRKKWQPTPVFLPLKSHGQRCLVGSSPEGPTQLQTTAREWIRLVMNFKSLVFDKSVRDTEN